MATTTHNQSTDSKSAEKKLSEKYLTFKISQELFGISILQAQEIIGIQQLVSVPRLPDYFRGVMNLRGRIIPVIDLRVKFGYCSKEDTERTCIVIVGLMQDGHKNTYGLVVDEISEVIEVNEADRQSTAGMELKEYEQFISSIAQLGETVFMLLDLRRVIAEEDSQMADKAISQAEELAGDDEEAGL